MCGRMEMDCSLNSAPAISRDSGRASPSNRTKSREAGGNSLAQHTAARSRGFCGCGSGVLGTLRKSSAWIVTHARQCGMANDRARKGGCAFSPGWSAAESWVSRMTRVRADFSRRHICRPYATWGMKGTLPRTAPPKSGGLSWAELSRPAVAGRESRQVSLKGKPGSRPVHRKPSLTIRRSIDS